MDKRTLINEISGNYNMARMQNDELRAIERLVREGTATFEQINEAADVAGRIVAESVWKHYDSFGSGGEIAIEDGTELFASLLMENHDYVTSLAESIQRHAYEFEDIGLNPVAPQFKQERAREIAEAAEQGITQANFENRCETVSRKSVDDFIQANAEAQDNAGLEVKVTRTYDGVGLSNGRTCEWCLERCGVDMSYHEAMSIGAFQRHDGCGCVITYTSAKGKKTYQTGKGGWKEVPDSDTLKKRKEYVGSRDGRSVEQKLSQIHMMQEGRDSVKPADLRNDFSEFKPLELTLNETEALSTLKRFSGESGYEYGIIIDKNGDISDPFTSKLADKVGFDLGQYGDGLSLLHSHTNETPPSTEDFAKFVNAKVDRIMSVAVNGDSYSVSINGGIRPSKEEFSTVSKQISDDVDELIFKSGIYDNYSIEEKNYLATRETAFRLSNYFEWDMSGGIIDE